MDCKLLTGAFVECALPPVGEVVDWVEQSFGTEVSGSYAEYGYLLSLAARNGCSAVAGNETAVVGE